MVIHLKLPHDELIDFIKNLNPSFKLVKYNKVNPGVNANNELVFKNEK